MYTNYINYSKHIINNLTWCTAYHSQEGLEYVAEIHNKVRKK